MIPTPIYVASILPCCVAEVRSNVQKSVHCVIPSCVPNVACQTLDECITDGTLNDSRCLANLNKSGQFKNHIYSCNCTCMFVLTHFETALV